MILSLSINISRKAYKKASEILIWSVTFLKDIIVIQLTFWNKIKLDLNGEGNWKYKEKQQENYKIENFIYEINTNLLALPTKESKTIFQRV